MKKILSLLILLALAYFGHQWLVSQPKTEPKNATPSPAAPAGAGAGVAEMHGIVAPEAAQGAAPAASAPAAPSPAAPDNVFVCTQPVDAFDPAQPSQQIGTFQPGSALKLGNVDAASGKIAVAFQEKNGTVIRALCRPEDVGKKPQSAPAVAQPPSAPPASGGRPTTMSIFKNRINKIGDGN